MTTLTQDKREDWIPELFIGSSTESIKIAESIRDQLESDVHCTLWNEDFFGVNSSTYDTLVKKSILFDYAVFVGGKDDKAIRIREGTEKLSARDNVYLEFGLYAGILTPSRTFFVFDRECAVPTDMHGISVLQYSSSGESFVSDELEKACEKIKKKIREEERLARIMFLPSTSLARGYFENFMKPVVETVYDMESLRVGDKEYNVKKTSKKLRIVIPDDLETDWMAWADKFHKDYGLESVAVQGKLRRYGARIDEQKLLSDNELILFDVPQTLRMSFEAVKMVLGPGAIGEVAEIGQANKREVNNFIKTLKNLIQTNEYAKELVEIWRG